MANISREEQGTRGLVLALAACVLLVALYLTGLTRMGMYGPDEPRYADIGRAMAHTGDWITPRLWGQPWFEKPALLYWMTAVGFSLNLGPDLAPRLPVALLGLGFLLFFHRRLTALFGRDTAMYATGMLATSAGWFAYSHVAVTDLPLTACFSAAVLLALSSQDESNDPAAPAATPSRRIAAAAALGLAVLAKSIPPLVLFLPVLLFDIRNWRRWLASWPLAVFLTIALPWHIAATLRNGPEFLYVLFIQQQFGRFFSHALLHEQRWWFYAPVFLLLLFPWSPLLALSARHIGSDRRIRTLFVIVATGLVFFSASVNKLPGYVLPLVPATCVLMGYGLAHAERRQRWLIVPIALLGLLPAVSAALPEVAASGLRNAHFPIAFCFAGLAVAGAAGTMLAWRPGAQAFSVAIVLAAVCFLYTAYTLFPGLDRAGSGRQVWAASHPDCAPVLPRQQLYGLYYYSGKRLPDCGIVDKKAVAFRADGPTK